jgi:hypothetical protein
MNPLSDHADTLTGFRRNPRPDSIGTGGRLRSESVASFVECALSAEEAAVVVAFRRHTLLPPDDCLYAVQPTIPHLTRLNRAGFAGGSHP